MQFDPDAYLAATDPQHTAAVPPPIAAAGFDPDAYLKATEPKWSDVPGNAWEDVKGIGKGLYALGEKAVGLPNEARDTATMMALGKDFGETPIGQDASAVGNVVKNALPHKDEIGHWRPGSVIDRIKELTPGIGHPVDAFIEHPVNTVMDVGAVAAPFIEGTEAGRAGLAAAKEASQSALQKMAGPLADTLEENAVGSGQRALGFTKRFLNKDPRNAARAADVTRTMLDEGVVTNPLTHPLSSGADDMADRVQGLMDKSGQQMGMTRQLLDANGIKGLDATESAAKVLDQLDPKFADEHSIAQQIGDDITALGKDRLSYDDSFRVLQKLKQNAKFSPLGSPADQLRAKMYRQAYGIFSDEMDKAIERGGAMIGDSAGVQAGAYDEAKKNWGAAKEAQRALTNRLSSEAGNKSIGLTDTIAGGAELAAGNPGKAAMLIGAKRVLERYGGAASAAINDHLADVVREAPEAFGKYAGQLTQAASRGNQALAVQHFLLQQTDPEYRKMLEAFQP